MTDRELMQQALDALESLQAWPETPENFKRFRAIEALRARLAQPEPAECDGGQCGIGGYCKQCPKTQLEQKPVAWGLQQQFEAGIGTTPVAFKRHDEFGFVVPLYTAPPQREWVGLTREELAEIAEFHFHGALSGREFYDDIEAKLKEKNT